MTAHVYFLQAGTGGRIKIGFSAASVERRKAGNQTGCPDALILLGVVAGDERLERRFHKAFGRYRVRGEWFIPHPRLVNFIARVGRDLPAAEPPQKPEGLSALQELAWVIDTQWTSRRAFARAVGLGESYMSLLLGGARPLGRVPFSTIVQICRLSGVSITTLADHISADTCATVPVEAAAE